MAVPFAAGMGHFPFKMDRQVQRMAIPPAFCVQSGPWAPRPRAGEAERFPELKAAVGALQRARDLPLPVTAEGRLAAKVR